MTTYFLLKGYGLGPFSLLKINKSPTTNSTSREASTSASHNVLYLNKHLGTAMSPSSGDPNAIKALYKSAYSLGI